MLQTVLGEIEERMNEPTARGLAGAVGRAVGDGAIVSGQKLPPIRAVATELGLSPTTVSSAWNLLRRAGTVHTDGRRGTVVAARRPGPVRYRSVLGRRELFTLDLSTGTPDPGLLPDVTAALRRIRPPAEPTTYLDDPVLPELGELLHADWPFPAQRITVVDGAMDAMALVVGTHLRFGDRAAVEQPCFPPLLDLLDSVGVTPVPVRVDDDGPLPGDLARAVGVGVRAVFVQPRAQNPCGAAVTPARVDELAAVLRAADVVVVEDDSAGAVAAVPVRSLGRALPERTLHVRSYSKSHGPDLRLAGIGGAADLVDPVVERRFLGQGWTSRLLQRVLVDLLTHAPTVHAVEQARTEYAQRRAKIVDQLATAGIDVPGRDGLNIWLPVRDEAAALLRLATTGIGAAGGRPFWVGAQSNPDQWSRTAGYRPHLRLTVGLVATGHRAVAEHLIDAARMPKHSVRR
jgi:DNA-binding transcriptional MocR family regulator